MFEELIIIADAPLLLLAVGLLIGLYHALEPDHIVAMTALAKRQNQKSKNMSINRRYVSIKGAIHGMLWGFGHTTTIFLILVTVFVFSANIPLQIFGFFEIANGLMLIVLGAFAILGNKIPILSKLHFYAHSHSHTHEDGTAHSHPHTHNSNKFNQHVKHNNNDHAYHKHGHRSYLIGCVHGLAGSGGLVILLGATIADGTHAPLVFASMFSIGSIIGMVVITSIFSFVLVLYHNANMLQKIIKYGLGTTAIIIGVYFLVTETTHLLESTPINL